MGFGITAILVDHKASLSSNKATFDAINFQDKLSIELKDFSPTLLKPHDYKLLFGYNKPFLYKQAFNRTIPLLLVFWSVVLVFIIMQLIYSRTLKADIF